MAYPNPFDLQHHRFGSGGDLVEEFLATYSKRGTRRSYRSDLQQFFGEEGAVRQEVSLVQKEDITAFLKQRVEDSLKRSTLKRKLEAIRSFFRWVAKQNMIDELPISDGMDTGDLVYQVFEEAHKTTEAEGDSPTAEEPDGKDEGDSERSPRGPMPMELEPGSEVNLGEVNTGGETDSGPDESSSPGSRPEAGAGTEPTPGTEDTESPSSEAPSREELQSGESSSDSSTGSDHAPAEEGPSKECSIEDQDAREEPIGEGKTEENSADDDSTGDNSDGEDQPSIPDWAFASGEANEIDLHRGEQVALVDLPDVLRGALPQLRDLSGPEGLFIRCTGDLKVRIRRRRGEDSQIIEASIEHYGLQRNLRNGRDLSEERVLRQAILYLHNLNWTLPRRVYDLVGALQNPDDTEGPFSEERPRWCQEGTGGRMGDAFLAALITGVLAEGFGMGKDEQVFVGT